MIEHQSIPPGRTEGRRVMPKGTTPALQLQPLDDIQSFQRAKVTSWCVIQNLIFVFIRNKSQERIKTWSFDVLHLPSIKTEPQFIWFKSNSAEHIYGEVSVLVGKKRLECPLDPNSHFLHHILSISKTFTAYTYSQHQQTVSVYSHYTPPRWEDQGKDHSSSVVQSNDSARMAWSNLERFYGDRAERSLP